MSEGKDWCRHVFWIEDMKTYTMSHIGVKINDFDFCPICGAPRPEEPKELWEVLRKNREKYGCGSGKEYWHLQADTAKTYLRKRMEEELADLYPASLDYTNYSSIKTVLDKVFGEK